MGPSSQLMAIAAGKGLSDCLQPGNRQPFSFGQSWGGRCWDHPCWGWWARLWRPVTSAGLCRSLLGSGWCRAAHTCGPAPHCCCDLATTRRSPGAPLLGSGVVWLTGCHSRACCSFKTFRRWFQLFGVQRTHGYFVLWKVAIVCIAQTYWPILVNETVPRHSLKHWDTVGAIADSLQHCFCQGQTVLFQKTSGDSMRDSMGSSPETAPLKTVQPYGYRTQMDIYSQGQRMAIDPLCLLVHT